MWHNTISCNISSVGNFLDESTDELDGLEIFSEISILEIIGDSVGEVSLFFFLLGPVETAASVDCCLPLYVADSFSFLMRVSELDFGSGTSGKH